VAVVPRLVRPSDLESEAIVARDELRTRGLARAAVGSLETISTGLMRLQAEEGGVAGISEVEL
jgi:hypothetical protein